MLFIRLGALLLSFGVLGLCFQIILINGDNAIIHVLAILGVMSTMTFKVMESVSNSSKKCKCLECKYHRQSQQT